MNLTLEQKIERVKDLRPIDDVLFEVLADDKEVMQEMLRTILEAPELVVMDVIVQSSQRNLYGRSVRLDALCMLNSGEKVNVEVQRSDADDHLRRVRFNASVITARESNPGEYFEDVQELYIVYISEFDVFEKGKTVYHVENVIRETGDTLDDGLHRLFVNTTIDDGSEISDLMSCFTKKMVSNSKFPRFTERMKEIKTTEGGMSAVCAVMEKYEKQAREEGREEGRIAESIEIYRKEMELDNQTILARIMEKFKLDRKTAEGYVLAESAGEIYKP